LTTAASYREIEHSEAARVSESGGHELMRIVAVDEGSAADARRAVAGAARAAGLANGVVDDLELVVATLVKLAVEGGGEATVRIVRDRARWVCEVSGPGVDESLGASAARLVTENVDVASGAAPRVRITFESGMGDVRGRILDAASELFYRDGIRATGVTAIIANAGVAKASFYHHFPSKEDVITAWLRRRTDRWLDRFVHAEQVTPPYERLLANDAFRRIRRQRRIRAGGCERGRVTLILETWEPSSPASSLLLR
jgi:hypothetical protein